MLGRRFRLRHQFIRRRRDTNEKETHRYTRRLFSNRAAVVGFVRRQKIRRRGRNAGFRDDDRRLDFGLIANGFCLYLSKIQEPPKPICRRARFSLLTTWSSISESSPAGALVYLLGSKQAGFDCRNDCFVVVCSRGIKILKRKMMIGYILFIYLVLYFVTAFALPTYRVWKEPSQPVTFRGAGHGARLHRQALQNRDARTRAGGHHLCLCSEFLSIFVADCPAWKFRNSIRWYRTVSCFPRLDDSRANSNGQFVAHRNWWGKGNHARANGTFRFPANQIFLGIQTYLDFFSPRQISWHFFDFSPVLFFDSKFGAAGRRILSKTHGAEYDDFRSQVRRWL